MEAALEFGVYWNKCHCDTIPPRAEGEAISFLDLFDQ